MGLFSGFRKDDTRLDIPTAAMIPCVVAILADGSVEDDEIHQLRSMCIHSPIYARNSKEEDDAIILRASRLVNNGDNETVCRMAAEILGSNLSETAFCFAVRLVFSDGHVGTKETALLENLVGWLGIDEEVAKAIFLATDVFYRSSSGADA